MKLLMFFLLFLTGLLSSQHCAGQVPVFYVAAKSGLSMRDQPDAKAVVVGKVPYGSKITVSYPEAIVNITTEGIEGAWAKTTYNGKTGWVVNSYLLPVVPPKASVKTMKDYLAQLSPLFGGKLVVRHGSMNNIEESGWELHKQLYRNGAEWHDLLGYEHGSTTYFLPNFTIQQGFLLLRLIPEFNDAWNEKDEFPTQSKTFKKGENEYEIKVEKETIGDFTYFRKIHLEYVDGAVYIFEMYEVDNQLVIFFGSGV